MELTKAQAAARLGVSERAIERAVSAGKLHPRTEKRPGGGEIKYYDVDDLDSYAQRKASVIEESPAARSGGSALTLVPAQQAAEALAAALPDALGRALALALEQIGRPDVAPTSPPVGASVSDLAAKLTLTLDEAAAVAGLSRESLRLAIKAGELDGRMLGRGWRVRPEDLRAYVDRQWKRPASKAAKGAR